MRELKPCLTAQLVTQSPGQPFGLVLISGINICLEHDTIDTTTPQPHVPLNIDYILAHKQQKEFDVVQCLLCRVSTDAELGGEEW